MQAKNGLDRSISVQLLMMTMQAEEECWLNNNLARLALDLRRIRQYLKRNGKSGKNTPFTLSVFNKA